MINFPYSELEWSEVEKNDWQKKIETWFERSLKIGTPIEDIFPSLLDHIFSVIQTKQSLMIDKTMRLSKSLLNKLPESKISDLEEGHYRRILKLIELGLHQRHPHLFVFPQIDKDNFLNNQRYTALLLAVKVHAEGLFKEAQDLLNGIEQKCPLAQYVIGQGYRKDAIYESALHYFEDANKELENWANHQCPFNKGFKPLCAQHLLLAEVLRGKAVVHRRKGDKTNAERFYDDAINVLKERPASIPSAFTHTNWSDTIEVNYEQAAPVEADVYFSIGYYWYGNANFEKAKESFNASIHALEDAEVDWDSPYTRLGIIHICEERWGDARKILAKAVRLCRSTIKEHETPLSLSLCVLGLQIVDLIDKNSSGVATREDSLQLLEEALNKINFSKGPLECHRDDAKMILTATELPFEAQELINNFIKKIEIRLDILRRQSDIQIE